MNVGIIAASLIAMRPCLKAIHNAVVTRCHFQKIFTRNDSQTTIPRGSGLMQGRGIVRTVELELESQPTSTRDVTTNNLF